MDPSLTLAGHAAYPCVNKTTRRLSYYTVPKTLLASCKYTGGCYCCRLDLSTWLTTGTVSASNPYKLDDAFCSELLTPGVMDVVQHMSRVEFFAEPVSSVLALELVFRLFRWQEGDKPNLAPL